MAEARVLVAGASGYAGALGAALIAAHPSFELAAISARSDLGARLRDLYPRYRVDLPLVEIDSVELESIDAAIVAYPHGAAAPLVARLRAAAIRVVDLSADFRLRDLDVYRKWYGEPAAPELIGEAVYGLPELYRDQISGADLIAGPGCYPTATILALAPLARAGLITDLVVDAKSGVSGAGRGGGDRLSFVTVSENLIPYGTTGHRHQPEIAQELAALSGAAAPPLTFVPHLVPLDQGELVSCYVATAEPIAAADLADLYRDAYDGERFATVCETPPGVRDVRASNDCQIHPLAAPSPEGRVAVFAAIDNLWKGAAGQAIQCLNLMYGLDEAEGL